METKDLIGKIFIKKETGTRYKIIDCKESLHNDIFDFCIKLEGSNSLYNVTPALKKAFVFEDEGFQKEVENFIIGKTEEDKWRKKLDEIIAIVIKMRNNELYKRYISYEKGCISDGLRKNLCYGRVGQEIYRDCCRYFNWKFFLRGNFGMMQLMYAENATPEGYSVWMLPHNNYIGDTTDKWANVIEGDCIYEVRFIEEVGDSTDRVTFAKQPDGEYVFLGVYAYDKREVINKVYDGIMVRTIKCYKRISETYPE